tara:strand:- start:97986 stop:98102 length:117 start_codon:yes stop_codon:yes gene_type:complete
MFIYKFLTSKDATIITALVAVIEIAAVVVALYVGAQLV